MSRWPLRPLRDLVVETEKIDPRKSPELEFQYVDISSVDNEIGVISEPRTLRGNEAPLRARKVIRVNDVIVATTRPYLNQVALVPPELDGKVCSTGFCVLRSNGQVHPRFLYRFTRSKRFIDQVVPRMRGSAYPAVSDSDVLEAVMPVPPLDEQRRIVARLDASLARMAEVAGVARDLGRITEGAQSAWLEGVFKERSTQWRWVEIGEVAEVAYGVTKNPARSPARSPVPYLRVANVQRGYLDLTEVKYLEIGPGEMDRWRLLPGDVLLCEGNSSEFVGRAAVFQGEIENCVHQNHVIRVRPKPGVMMGEFLLAYVNSRAGQAYFRSKAKKTTNLATINSSEVRAMPVPVPTLDEQRGFASRLGAIRERVASIQSQREDCTRLLETARTAILDGAFNGDGFGSRT